MHLLKFTFLLLILEISILSTQVFALKVIKSEDQSIYMDSLKLPSGEQVYFGFEPIYNKDRQMRWRNYCDWASYFARESYDYLNREPLKTQLPQGQSTLQQQGPFYSDVVNLLRKSPDKQKMTKALDGVISGISGMHTSIGDYITYVSKKPIKGFLPLPSPKTVTGITEKERGTYFLNNFDDILMCVSSYLWKDIPQAYEHRGIFRNPMSMLRKDYRGLGILIHAFTGKVRTIQNTKLRIVTVRPDNNRLMRHMLLDTFSGDEMFPGETVLSDLNRSEFKDKFNLILGEQFIKDAGFYPDDIAIKLSSLIKRFPGTQK